MIDRIRGRNKNRISIESERCECWRSKSVGSNLGRDSGSNRICNQVPIATRSSYKKSIQQTNRIIVWHICDRKCSRRRSSREMSYCEISGNRVKSKISSRKRSDKDHSIITRDKTSTRRSRKRTSDRSSCGPRSDSSGIRQSNNKIIRRIKRNSNNLSNRIDRSDQINPIARSTIYLRSCPSINKRSRSNRERSTTSSRSASVNMNSVWLCNNRMRNSSRPAKRRSKIISSSKIREKLSIHFVNIFTIVVYIKNNTLPSRHGFSQSTIKKKIAKWWTLKVRWRSRRGGRRQKCRTTIWRRSRCSCWENFGRNVHLRSARTR